MLGMKLARRQLLDSNTQRGYSSYLKIDKLLLPTFLIVLTLTINTFAGNKIKYPLTINKVGEGSVVPGVGTYYYDAGTTAFFNAIPTADYAFDHWEGDYQGTSWFGNILMDSPKTITAIFTPADWQLTLTHSGNANGFTFPGPGIYGFLDGQQIGISAGTSEGVYFGGWSGDIGYNLPYSEFITITVNSDKYIDARFTNTGHILNVYVEGEGGATPGPFGNPHRFSEDAVLSITAYQTNPLWRFDHWSGDIDENEPRYYILLSIPMNRDREITAHFIEKPYYTLTLEIQGQGTVSIQEGFDDPIYYTTGIYQFSILEWTYIRCEAINSEPGWVFDHWEGDFGDTLPTYPRCSFSMDQNRSIKAVFVELPLEGEGIPEGSYDGEGSSEGTPEGAPEGAIEGEGPLEGTTEGEGNPIEGIIEGEGSVEGLPEGEGITEGSTEGETCIWNEPCPNFNYEGTRYASYFGGLWGNCDSNNSRIPDEWEIEIIKDLLCSPKGIWNDQFICAYTINYLTLKTEPKFYSVYYPFRHILAGLLTIGENNDILTYLLMMTKTYTPFTLNEELPLISSGDADGDGISNYDEYLFTLSYGGDKSVFLKNFFSPIPVPSYQSTDVNRNYRIELSELLRIIQFLNSSGFHCEEGTEDGYAPGYEGYYDFSCQPHTADYNPQNWHISLEEILRTIQFFNSAGYFLCPFFSEDHYCILETTF